jgi:hypothetical protein
MTLNATEVGEQIEDGVGSVSSAHCQIARVKKPIQKYVGQNGYNRIDQCFINGRGNTEQHRIFDNKLIPKFY